MSPSPSTSAAKTDAAPIGGGGDHAAGPRSSAAAVVLVPGDLVVVDGRGEHVHVAVAVHVRREDARRPIVGEGRDHLPGPEAPRCRAPPRRAVHRRRCRRRSGRCPPRPRPRCRGHPRRSRPARRPGRRCPRPDRAGRSRSRPRTPSSRPSSSAVGVGGSAACGVHLGAVERGRRRRCPGRAGRCPLPLGQVRGPSPSAILALLAGVAGSRPCTSTSTPSRGRRRRCRRRGVGCVGVHLGAVERPSSSLSASRGSVRGCSPRRRRARPSSSLSGYERSSARRCSAVREPVGHCRAGVSGSKPFTTSKPSSEPVVVAVRIERVRQFVCSYQAILSSLTRGREHVRVAVAVDVRREDERPRRRAVVIAAGREAPWSAVVLVPGDLVVVHGGGEHVRVAVAVHVGGEDREAPSAAVEITCWAPKLPAAVHVLVPGDLVVVRGRGEHVRCRRRRPRPPRRPRRPRRPSVEITCCGAEASLAVRVLVPGDLVVVAEAESTSVSPSPSTSAAKTEKAPSAAVEITCCGAEAPLAVRVLVPGDLVVVRGRGEHVRSPSPSTSAAKTDWAPSAAVEISCCAVNAPWPSVFSYQAILSSSQDAESTSVSPSPSTSAAKTDDGAVGGGRDHLLRRRSVPAAVRVLVPGDLVVVAGGGEHVRSPSPSTSAAKTERRASASVEITCWAPKLPVPSSVPVEQSVVVAVGVVRVRARRASAALPRSIRVEVVLPVDQIVAVLVRDRAGRSRSRPRASRRRVPESCRSVSCCSGVERRASASRQRRSRRDGAVEQAVAIAVRIGSRPFRLSRTRRSRRRARRRRARPCRRRRPRPRRRRSGPRRRWSRSPAGARSCPPRPCSRTRRSRRRRRRPRARPMSPSPSTSAAKTDWAPSATVEITCCAAEASPAPSVFSYQAISSSLSDAESTSDVAVAVHVRGEDGRARRRRGSRSPAARRSSPGRRCSRTRRSRRRSRRRRARPCRRRRRRRRRRPTRPPSARIEITCCAPKLPRAVRVLVPGDLVVVRGGGEHVRVAVAVDVGGEDGGGPVGQGRDHLLRAEASLPVRVLVPGDLVVEREAESTSVSPSPSTSAAKTRVGAVGEGRDHLLRAEASPGRPCSRTRRSRRRAGRRRARPVSPSPSTSAAKTE